MRETRFNGERLRAARELKGFTLRATAGEAHIDPSYLSRIENGLQVPSMTVVYRLADVLGIRPVKQAIELLFEFPLTTDVTPVGGEPAELADPGVRRD